MKHRAASASVAASCVCMCGHVLSHVQVFLARWHQIIVACKVLIDRDAVHREAVSRAGAAFWMFWLSLFWFKLLTTLAPAPAAAATRQWVCNAANVCRLVCLP